jgi:phosphoribosyl 1,2-cyclic phosphodiesterase
MHHIRTADLLVLEANHEVNILKMGPYPWPLKQRILGEEGHLSNEVAARAIIEMLAHRREDRPVPKILLAHLSRENNTPQQAYITVQNLLFEEGFYVNRDLELSVLPRDDVSPLIEV